MSYFQIRDKEPNVKRPKSSRLRPRASKSPESDLDLDSYLQSPTSVSPVSRSYSEDDMDLDDMLSPNKPESDDDIDLDDMVSPNQDENEDDEEVVVPTVPTLELYSDANKPALDENTYAAKILKVVAVLPGLCASEVVEVVLRADQLDEPTIQFDSQTGETSITCSHEDATFRYTIDGSNPDLRSPVFTPGKLKFNPMKPMTSTVKCVAYKPGYSPSNIATKALQILKCAEPHFNPKNSNGLLANPYVSLTCPTEGAEIRYLIQSESFDGGLWVGADSLDELVGIHFYVFSIHLPE